MNVSIYARYSSNNQREESIDAQVLAIENYCKQNNHSIILRYTDEALSATSDNRPAFQKMIKDAEKGLFKAVIVHKLDRFSRDKYDSAIYKRKLKNAGVRLISVTENIDGSPESIILESMLEGMAQYYSENLAREVRKGLNQNALKCKHTGGKPPFGYDVDKDLNYIINEHEAIAVRKIFEDYSDGKSYHEIIEWLTINGYNTKYNKPFQQTTLNNIFKNEKYKGVYVYNRTKQTKNNGIRVDVINDAEDIIRIDDGIPAIVSKELFDIVAQRLAENKTRIRSNRAKEEYLLTGKIFCGYCGAVMFGNSKNAGRNKHHYVLYTCSGRKKLKSCRKKDVNRDFIEDFVINFLETELFDNNEICCFADKVYSYYRKVAKNSGGNIKAHEKKLKEVEKQIDNITSAIADGMYNPSMKQKMNDLETLKNEIISMIHDEKNKSQILSHEKVL